jgi:hypothetical protein
MGTDNETSEVVMRGIYIGNDVRCYDMARKLSLRVNINLLDRALRRVVVYLKEEYRLTWLGNKSIYRTRMAINKGENCSYWPCTSRRLARMSRLTISSAGWATLARPGSRRP